MVEIRFDFVHSDYRLNAATGEFQSQAKEPGKTGKAGRVLEELFQRAQHALSREQATHLASFCKELSVHLEGSYQRRYWIFSWLILYIGKMLGNSPIIKLEELAAVFNEKIPLAPAPIPNAPPPPPEPIPDKKNEAKAEIDALLAQIPEGFADNSFIQALPKRLASIVDFDPSSHFLYEIAKKAGPKSAWQQGFERVAKRYETLKDIPLSAAEKLQLAYFIEIRLPKLTGLLIHKMPAEDLPRSIHINPETLDMYVPLKRKGEAPIAMTKGKKVTRAILLSNVPPHAKMIAQLTSLDSTKDSQRTAMVREYAIAKELQGNEGIWPVHYCCEYVKKGKIPKVSEFADLAEANFSQRAKALSFEEIVEVTKKLLRGLSEIHKRNYVHADIKGDNALLGPNPGWIDFGLSGKATPQEAPHFFEGGFYGTKEHAAPELFGVQGFFGDYFKTDVWALGLMLYRRYLRREPSWFSLVGAKGSVDYAQKAEYKRRIHEAIEVPLAALQPQTRQERFTALIYKMMRLHPEDRLSVAESLAELDRL